MDDQQLLLLDDQRQLVYNEFYAQLKNGAGLPRFFSYNAVLYTMKFCGEVLENIIINLAEDSTQSLTSLDGILELAIYTDIPEDISELTVMSVFNVRATDLDLNYLKLSDMDKKLLTRYINRIVFRLGNLAYSNSEKRQYEVANLPLALSRVQAAIQKPDIVAAALILFEVAVWPKVAHEFYFGN